MGRAVEELGRRLAPVEDGRYLIGLSGGADSVELLMMLLPAVRGGRIRAEAVHVNHGLRGAESDEDERFCRELCEKECIPLYICRANLSGRRDEAAAREARYAAFRNRCNETGVNAVILAHQADDQAETFMMKLLRGAGPDGLACMKNDETANGIRMIRPMLSMRRAEIREALRSDGISWREDSSNEDSAYLRNRLRSELMPVLDSFCGSSVEKICRAAGLIGCDNDALKAEAAERLERFSDDCLMDAEALSREPYAVRSRVLRMWWTCLSRESKERALSARQTEALDRLLFTGRGRINLPDGMHAVRDGRYLFLQGEKTPPPEPVTVVSGNTAFGFYRLTEGPSAGSPGDGKGTQEVPAGFARGCVIRTRLPGDRIRPFGSSGSRKLQDYLTDRKIPEPFRDMIPLLCREGEVLLVCGVGAGNIPRWDGNRENVRLEWHGNMPWRDL